MQRGNFDLSHVPGNDGSVPTSTYKDKMVYNGPVKDNRFNIRELMFTSVELGPKGSKLEDISETKHSYIKPDISFK